VKVFHLHWTNPGARGASSPTSKIASRCGQAAGDCAVPDFFADLSPIFPFVLPGLRFPILDRRNGLAIGQFKSPDAIMKNLTQNPPGITSFAIDDATNYASVAVEKFASLVSRISDITSSHQARR
jgi:hypothetical protein